MSIAYPDIQGGGVDFNEDTSGLRTVSSKLEALAGPHINWRSYAIFHDGTSEQGLGLDISTAVGASAAAVNNEGETRSYRQKSTAATANAQAGFRFEDVYPSQWRAFLIPFRTTADITAMRFFCGWTATLNISTIDSTTSPNNSQYLLYDPANLANSNLWAIEVDGAGSETQTDTELLIAADTEYLILALRDPTTGVVKVYDVYTDELIATMETDIPDNATRLYLQDMAVTDAAAVRSWAWGTVMGGFGL